MHTRRYVYANGAPSQPKERVKLNVSRYFIILPEELYALIIDEIDCVCFLGQIKLVLGNVQINKKEKMESSSLTYNFAKVKIKEG